MNRKKIKDIKEGWWNYIKSQISETLSSEIKELAEKRIIICKSCLYLKQSRKNKYICCLCGCSFPAIVYAPKKRCPDGKW